MKKSLNMWNTITAAAITTILTMGGATLAGEGFEVEQRDPYAGGNWTAQTTTPLNNSDIDQTDPYGNGNWTAQDTRPLRGSDIEQNDPYGNDNWTVQPMLRLAGVMNLCNNRLTRRIVERGLGIDLNCP